MTDSANQNLFERIKALGAFVCAGLVNKYDDLQYAAVTCLFDKLKRR